jgi:hypothetical protein
MRDADYQRAFESILRDPRYLRNIEWGEPRTGHPEGSIRAHIAELEANLDRLRPRLNSTEYWKLKLLIHTHDTFKGEAAPNVPIVDPHSHASLARAFLAEFCADQDLLAMVQYHDEPYALWLQQTRRGTYNEQRMSALEGNIKDWNVFVAFLLVDGATAGKSREPLRWFLGLTGAQMNSKFTVDDIL